LRSRSMNSTLLAHHCCVMVGFLMKGCCGSEISPRHQP
jgi:hypothetical protein